MFDQDFSSNPYQVPDIYRAERVFTNDWPRGDTVGPCREWHDMMLTSWGRYLSKASFAGALKEIWPVTIAPTFVAGREVMG